MKNENKKISSNEDTQQSSIISSAKTSKRNSGVKQVASINKVENDESNKKVSKKATTTKNNDNSTKNDSRVSGRNSNKRNSKAKSEVKDENKERNTQQDSRGVSNSADLHKSDNIQAEANNVESKVDKRNRIRTYTPKSKPASKTMTAAVQKFFKENEKIIRLMNYSLGKNSILRVLDTNGPESFMNIDNNYYMYNKDDQSVKDFGDIFEIGIDAMMDVPWLDSD